MKEKLNLVKLTKAIWHHPDLSTGPQNLQKKYILYIISQKMDWKTCTLQRTQKGMLSDMTNISKASLKRRLKELEIDGYIRIIGGIKDGKRTQSKYILQLKRLTIPKTQPASIQPTSTPSIQPASTQSTSNQPTWGDSTERIQPTSNQSTSNQPASNQPTKKEDEVYNPWRSGQKKVDFERAKSNVLVKNNWGEWVNPNEPKHHQKRKPSLTRDEVIERLDQLPMAIKEGLKTEQYYVKNFKELEDKYPAIYMARIDHQLFEYKGGKYKLIDQSIIRSQPASIQPPSNQPASIQPASNQSNQPASNQPKKEIILNYAATQDKWGRWT